MMIGKGVEDINTHMPKDAYDTGKDMPTLNAYLTVIVRDSKGNVIKVHRQRSHSPTANFIGLILPLTYFINTNSSYTLTNTGNSTTSYKPCSANGCFNISYPNTGINSPTYLVMIRVGNGKQTNPLTATNLASPIANGSGAGQLIYGAISVPSNIIVSGDSAYFYVAQSYFNQSGGTISITEVGMVINLILQLASSSGNTNVGSILTWYDVLSSSISIPNGGSLTIYYTFTVNP